MGNCTGDAFFEGGVGYLLQQVLQGLFVLCLCEGKGRVFEGYAAGCIGLGVNDCVYDLGHMGNAAAEY